MTNKMRWTVVLCLALMTLAGNLRAQSPERQQWAEIKAKMKAEGWKQITAGTFERQLGANKVEHLGYGREGLIWTIGELNRQLDLLTQEYQNYPSEDLANTIDNLSVRIAMAKRELRNMPENMSRLTAALTGASCSNICYSATADAFALTGTQGVGALAEAKFNSACGYSGQTYAYAYARATLNGTTTTLTKEDPDTGTNITSYASANVNGGSTSSIPCYSYASSWAESPTLGIYYQTSDVNNGYCPALPQVTITGTEYEHFLSPTAPCRSRTWSSTIINGVLPCTYQWKHNSTAVGTGSTYTRSICPNTGSFQLTLTVTCSNGSASDTHAVQVETGSGSGCGGSPCP